MGKKRGGDAHANAADAEGDGKFWCYYCDAKAKDEQALIQHQAAKHFTCTLCDKSSPGRFCLSLGGLLAHVRRSHKKELDRVPGAIEGRQNTAVDVVGMIGIPEEFLEARGQGSANAAASAAAAVQPPAPDLLDISKLLAASQAGPLKAAAGAAAVPSLASLRGAASATPNLASLLEARSAASGLSALGGLNKDVSLPDTSAVKPLSWRLSPAAAAPAPAPAPTPAPAPAGDAPKSYGRVASHLLLAASSAAGSDSGVDASAIEQITKALAAAGEAEPDAKTKALLAAMATNTPQTASDAENIIKVALQVATAAEEPEEPQAEEEDIFARPPPEPAPREPDQPVASAPAPTPATTVTLAPKPAVASVPTISFTPAKPLSAEAKAAAKQAKEASTSFVAKLMSQNAKLAADSRAAASLAKPAPQPRIAAAATKKKEVQRFALPRGAFLDHEAEEAAKARSDPKLYLGRLPRGLGEDGLRAEVSKYGTIESIFYHENQDDPRRGSWALVSFKSSEKVGVAVSRLNRRLGIFGSTEPVEVRPSNMEDILRMEHTLAALDQPADAQDMANMSNQLALNPQDRGRRGGRERRRSRSRRRRARSGSSEDSRPIPPPQRRAIGLGGFDNFAAAPKTVAEARAAMAAQALEDAARNPALMDTRQR
eukprot:TRINITY_DN24838_c0_g2_i2.p1 TRINITY_DN24838_c0_g2~~TRINITY_DN24838_c0_g2_i2.p1  ORF type:complete len:657 (+),score=135.86 TRINITY_DN24838_c0_g2_i2:48-2018(+)